jgi:signal transduction histidine kinase/CheY-like chemotaxis protein
VLKFKNTLSVRVVLGGVLFSLFITAIFVSLISATNEARRVDRASKLGNVMISAATAARAQLTATNPADRQDVKRTASIALSAAAASDVTPTARSGRRIRDATASYLRSPRANENRLVDALDLAIARQRAVLANNSAHLADALDRALRLGIIGLVGCILSVLIFGIDMVRSVTMPIRRVVTTTRRLANNQLSARVPEQGVWDMKELAGSINELARSLEKTNRELASQNKNLAASREDADRANQAKSEFLSRMSHELRTPLNAILGFAQLLELEDMTPRQRENLNHIVTGGKHLLDLINEVLEISRIEAGSMIPVLEPINGPVIVGETLDLVAPLAAQRGIELIPEVEGAGDVWIAADHQHLKQVLLNLVANAVKYNRENRGSVTVGVKQVGDFGQIYVRDTGMGIPKTKLSKLFVPFERLGAEGTDVEGTGLGLVLAQRLTEAMYGTITVESTEWVGSTFFVNIPLTNAPSYDTPAPAAEEPVAEEAEAVDDEQRTWKVLYIEDDAANARLMARLFQEEPRLELMTTMYGERGVAIARELQPDLILLDIHLPDIDGDEVIQILHTEWTTQKIPVIVVTADATDEQRSKMMGLGASDFLTKPLTLDALMSSVWDVLGKPRSLVKKSATPA